MPETDIDYAEVCDYESLKKSIKGVLRKYFQFDDLYEQNPEYNPNFSAQDAIDEIKDLVGGI